MKSSSSQKRRGLTQSVTTMILLVLSVLLASGTMGLYTFSVASSTMKTEQLVIRSVRIWADPSCSQVALHVENIGGRDALLTSIEVGYVEELWSSIYIAEGEGGVMTPAEGLNITGVFNHTVSGAEYEFIPATGSIIIPVSGSLMIYVDNPAAVDLQDLGTVVEVAVYTSTLPYVTMDDVESP
jgi:hypothetical protein